MSSGSAFIGWKDYPNASDLIGLVSIFIEEYDNLCPLNLNGEVFPNFDEYNFGGYSNYDQLDAS